MAKTLESPEHNETDKSLTSKSNLSENSMNTMATNLENRIEETLEDFDEQNLINHAINVTKMIPGSFYILGKILSLLYPSFLQKKIENDDGFLIKFLICRCFYCN